MPENGEPLQAFFALEQQKIARITALLDEIKRVDMEIDERVLDLYGITNAADRQRVLGSVPVEEEDLPRRWKMLSMTTRNEMLPEPCFMY